MHRLHSYAERAPEHIARTVGPAPERKHPWAPASRAAFTITSAAMKRTMPRTSWYWKLAATLSGTLRLRVQSGLRPLLRPRGLYCILVSRLFSRGFGRYSATIARPSFLSGLDRGGWELLPVDGCEIGPPNCDPYCRGGSIAVEGAKQRQYVIQLVEGATKLPHSGPPRLHPPKTLDIDSLCIFQGFATFGFSGLLPIFSWDKEAKKYCKSGGGWVVAHVCGDPLSRCTCRATRVAADFLRILRFFRCSSSIASHPPLKGPVAPVTLALPGVSHVKLPLKRCRATGGCSSYTCRCRATWLWHRTNLAMDCSQQHLLSSFQGLCSHLAGFERETATFEGSPRPLNTL